METFTQGLIIAERVRVRRERRLPVEGEVQAERGQRVRSETVLARAELPGRAEVVNLAAVLGVSPGEIPRCLLKGEGDTVEAGEVLGRSGGLFGLFRSSAASPVAGRVESVSTVTGQVVIRGAPLPVEVAAYLDGEVVDLFPGEGAAVEAVGSFVQGIFGVGGERWGELAVKAGDPTERLQPDAIDETCAGRIVVGGRGVAPGCLDRVAHLGVRGLIVGSITDADLRGFLGYDLGSAITGSEAVAATLVLTEGFGELPMGARTFDLLASCNGRRASINGRTQIRAGVIRPEVIVPVPEGAGESAAQKREAGSLRIGSRVRVAREPFFGRTGVVTGLPEEPVELETEARVRVVELALDDGRRARVPRSNVEAV